MRRVQRPARSAQAVPVGLVQGCAECACGRCVDSIGLHEVSMGRCSFGAATRLTHAIQASYKVKLWHGND